MARTLAARPHPAIRKGDKNMAGGKPDYIGTVNIYIADQKAFEEAGKKRQTIPGPVATAGPRRPA